MKDVGIIGDGSMIDEEICQKREELNQSIIDQKDYSIIYKISVELDELITKYYLRNSSNNNIIY